MVNAKVWIKNKDIIGLPLLEDFTLIKEKLDECQDGDVIISAEYLSVDPYMRYTLDSIPVNSSPVGSQVARVIESKNENYPVGSYLLGYPGWRSHTRLTRQELEDRKIAIPYTKVNYLGNHSPSTALGVLGMPGNTAYFGFLELCQPKEGETVLVNGAAGAVGSLVCQIAKIKGCKVVAFAGSDAKVAWIKELGIDHAFNYKKDDISEKITEAAPEGINCFFDNVGGDFSAKALPHMAVYGRISICGAISIYNETIQSALPSPYTAKLMLQKQLRVEGFLVHKWINKWDEGLTQMKKWLDDGDIKYKETVTDGFENLPKTFLGLFLGENIGKAVVKIQKRYNKSVINHHL